MRVYIVEDDPLIGGLLKMELEDNGAYQIDLVPSITALTDLLERQGLPEAIICDGQLGDHETAMDVRQALGSLPGFDHLRFLLHSASVPVKRRYAELYPEDVIVDKTGSFDRVVAWVERVALPSHTGARPLAEAAP